MPIKKDLIDTFNSFYFDGDLYGESKNWNGFIKNERLLVDKNFFKEINNLNVNWGFVSGAEPPSAKYVLEERLGLKNPPLIAMGDAPEKPNPAGFLCLIKRLSKIDINTISKPIAYLGDTVADVLTVKNAQKEFPKQKFISFAIAPPHLQKKSKSYLRATYENKLKKSGADFIVNKTADVIDFIKEW